MTNAEAWAREYASPPSFTACGHPSIERQHYPDGPPCGVVCRTCGHFWHEHSIIIPEDEYDTLLAYMAYRLDRK